MTNVPLFDAFQSRIFYIYDGLTHVSTAWHIPDNFSQAPGGGGATYDLVRRDAALRDFEAFVDEYVQLLKTFFAPTTNFFSAELWRYPEESQNAEFLTSYSINVDGDHINDNIPAAERIMTARTATGRIIKQYMEENVNEPNIPLAWVAGSGAAGDMGTYFLGDTCVIVDREAGYPISLLKSFYGQNEAIFRKRFRPT